MDATESNWAMPEEKRNEQPVQEDDFTARSYQVVLPWQPENLLLNKSHCQ